MFNKIEEKLLTSNKKNNKTIKIEKISKEEILKLFNDLFTDKK